MRPILGREPSLIIGAIGSLLTVLAALGLPWLDAGAAAAITALVSAGIIAATTRPVAPVLRAARLTEWRPNRVDPPQDQWPQPGLRRRDTTT
ncbi:hypothetical protein [Actinoplanes sp. N902-109]|uniref:hypothetical protein n=1 Tax=Actinoplanes sp. (strain N902-109) TaxID=649831 RepID=UPI00032968AD|nr:hypothetical protein [Actinoplanes sp. N902-109]AGL13890.1 Pas67 [Actinoplanes sp. N902-109]